LSGVVIFSGIGVVIFITGFWVIIFILGDFDQAGATKPITIIRVKMSLNNFLVFILSSYPPFLAAFLIYIFYIKIAFHHFGKRNVN
jgi:hypothetical protein